MKKCNISNEYGYKNILTSLGLLKKVKNDYKITNAALLLFSTNPRLFFPQSVVTCVLFKGTEKLTILDRKDLEGDLIELIEDTILFLKKHLNLRYEIKELQRKEYLEIPETALRESVVNAIVHRDYFEKGANIMVEIFDNRVVISNPGGLVKGLDIEDFGVRSITRNPLIATTMLRANYIERLGTGIKRIENSLKAEGLPNCEFNLTKFFSITFYRNNTNIYDKRIIENDTNLDTNNIKNKKNIYEKMILEEIKSNPKISASHLSDNIEVMTVDRVKYYLRKLKKKGIIYRVGNSRTGHWVVK